MVGHDAGTRGGPVSTYIPSSNSLQVGGHDAVPDAMWTWKYDIQMWYWYIIWACPATIWKSRGVSGS